MNPGSLDEEPGEMHCLILSDDFPNRLEPWRGPYHRRQVECLARLCQVTVVEPLAWPRLLANVRLAGLLGKHDACLDGVAVRHPLFLYLPVVTRGANWRGVLAAARRALRSDPGICFDVIFATFAYPHGYAARVLAAETGVPYVVKVRGSDLHSLPPGGARRRLTGEALQGAAAVMAVSGNLAEIAVQLGADPARLHVVLNGVDAGRFPAMSRGEARARLGLPAQRPVFLCVGHLLPVKGVDVLAAAFEAISGTGTLPDGAQLVFAGAGPMRRWLERRRDRTGRRDAVSLLGHISREQVALYMNAADVLVLPSRNEGCPNVVLEALSCGTPVVASRVGAVPDLIDDTCGIVVEPERPDALGAAMLRALERRWDRTAIRRRVEAMSWENNAAKLHAILLGAVKGSPQPIEACGT